MKFTCFLSLALPACLGGGAESGGGDTDSGGEACAPNEAVAIVTDIDETLTTDDLEWLYQIADADHDPEMRPDADTLMQGWHALGYRIFYVTARGEGSSLLDGTPAREATTGWLDAHGFPYAEEDVFLADDYGALGSAAATYKTEVLAGIQDAGVRVDWAYGNAETDVTAYQAGGIPDDHIFLVGDLAGEYGVAPIPNEDAYTEHLADFLPGVGCAE